MRFSPGSGPSTARESSRVSIVYPQSIAFGPPCSKRPERPFRTGPGPWWERFCPCGAGSRRLFVPSNRAYPGVTGTDPVAVGFLSSRPPAVTGGTPRERPGPGAQGQGRCRARWGGPEFLCFRGTSVCAAVRSPCAASRTRWSSASPRVPASRDRAVSLTPPTGTDPSRIVPRGLDPGAGHSFRGRGRRWPPRTPHRARLRVSLTQAGADSPLGLPARGGQPGLRQSRVRQVLTRNHGQQHGHALQPGKMEVPTPCIARTGARPLVLIIPGPRRQDQRRIGPRPPAEPVGPSSGPALAAWCAPGGRGPGRRCGRCHGRGDAGLHRDRPMGRRSRCTRAH